MVKCCWFYWFNVDYKFQLWVHDFSKISNQIVMVQIERLQMTDDLLPLYLWPKTTQFCLSLVGESCFASSHWSVQHSDKVNLQAHVDLLWGTHGSECHLRSGGGTCYLWIYYLILVSSKVTKRKNESVYNVQRQSVCKHMTGIKMAHLHKQLVSWKMIKYESLECNNCVQFRFCTF